jgi:hypothetical protein
MAPDVEGVEVMSTPTDPHVGMTFDSLDAAKSYYNLYAWYKGFGTRIDTAKSYYSQCWRKIMGSPNAFLFVTRQE